MSFGLCSSISVEIISVFKSEAHVTAHAVPLNNFIPGLYCYEVASYYYDGNVFEEPVVGKFSFQQELSCQQSQPKDIPFECSFNSPVPTNSPLLQSNTSETMNCIISVGVAVMGTCFATAVVFTVIFSITACFFIKKKWSCFPNGPHFETKPCASHQSQQSTDLNLNDNIAYATVN